jgi:hypothetical protein
MERPGYGDWYEISQQHYFSMYATTSHGPQSWRPYYLLKNLDAALGLCSGTCLIIWCMARRLIVVQIIGGAHAWNIVNIPRITTTTNCLKWPFNLQRR